VGGGQWAVGNRQSAISNRQSAISNQQSAIAVPLSIGDVRATSGVFTQSLSQVVLTDVSGVVIIGRSPEDSPTMVSKT
jgi:hypothetical protein